jgi:WD40 repeat protein
MDEKTLTRLLNSVQGHQPPGEFVLALRYELDQVLDEVADETYDTMIPEVARAEGDDRSPGRVTLISLPSPVRDGPRSRVLLAAAAVVLVIGTIAGIQLALRSEPSSVVATATELADQLVERSELPGTSPDLRLALLAEAAALDGRPDLMARLGMELQTGGHLRIGSRVIDGVYDVSISPDGRYVVLAHGANDGSPPSFQIWDVETGTLESIEFDVDLAVSTSFLPSGELVAIGFGQADRQAYEGTDTTRPVNVVQRDWESPRGDIGVLVLSTNVFLIDLATGDELARQQVALDPYSWRLNQDGSVMIAAQPSGVSRPAGIVVWDTSDPAGFTDEHPLAQLGASTARHMAFSPDGRLIAIATADRVDVLDATDLTLSRSITVGGSIVEVDFDPSGDTLFTIHDDDAIALRTFDVVTGNRILADIALDARVADNRSRSGDSSFDSTEFSDDGSRFVAITPDGTGVEVWALNRDEWVELACRATIERVELDDYPGLSRSTCAAWSLEQ